MKLVIFGATGGIGRELMAQALEGGHDVTVLVRSPAKVTLQHPKLRVVQGDVLVEESFAPALAGQDAVLLVLVGGKRSEPTTLYSEGAQKVLHAMKAQGLRRFVGVSASGFLDDARDGFLVKHLFKPMLQRMLKHHYDDLKRMEAEVMASGLDWTLVRPARLTDAAHTGVYRTARGGLVAKGSSISRADVADFMLKHVDDAALFGEAVGVAY